MAKTKKHPMPMGEMPMGELVKKEHRGKGLPMGELMNDSDRKGIPMGELFSKEDKKGLI